MQFDIRYGSKVKLFGDVTVKVNSVDNKRNEFDFLDEGGKTIRFSQIRIIKVLNY